jgi:hypothetical protein
MPNRIVTMMPPGSLAGHDQLAERPGDEADEEPSEDTVGHAILPLPPGRGVETASPLSAAIATVSWNDPELAKRSKTGIARRTKRNGSCGRCFIHLIQCDQEGHRPCGRIGSSHMNYEAGMFGRQERLEFTGEETTRKSRRWIWIVGVAIVVVGALAFFMMSGSKTAAPKGAAAARAPAAVASRRSRP